MFQNLEKILKKKNYIRWFLNRYTLKEEKAKMILEYLLHNEELLTKTHFVENIQPYASAFLISAEDAKTVSYLCRVEGQYYENIDELIEIIKSTPITDLYIWLSFDREFLCSACSGLIEESPEISFARKAKQQIFNVEREVINLLMEKEKIRTKLLEAIDSALINNNYEEFILLSNQLKEL